MVILAVLHLLTTFVWDSPWKAWIIPDSRLEVWIIFPAQICREKESNFDIPAKGTCGIGFVGNRPLQVGALCLHWSTEGNLRKFFWWYTIFEWQSFRCGILETMADIYLGVVVGLGSMYFLSDFWRALSWHSAPTLNLLLFQEGASSKVLLLVFHCRENVLRFLFAFGSSQIFHQIKIVFL